MRKVFKHKDFTAEFTDEHGYIALTGEIDGSSGAVGDEIAAIEPRLSLANQLHLSDCDTGEPMHAYANAKYYAECILRDMGQIGKKPEHTRKDIQDHLRISKDEADYFMQLMASIKLRNEEIQWIKTLLNSNDTTLVNDIEVEIHRLNKKKADLAHAEESLNSFWFELQKRWSQEAKIVYKTIRDLPEDLTDYEELEEFDPEEVDQPEKVRALAAHLDIDPALVEETYNNNMNSFTAQGSEYLVVDDDEADNLFEEDIENYIEECILPELPDNFRSYFDDEKFKRDAQMDGRGQALAKYDGEEHYEKDPETGEEYFIYKN